MRQASPVPITFQTPPELVSAMLFYLSVLGTKKKPHHHLPSHPLHVGQFVFLRHPLFFVFIYLFTVFCHRFPHQSVPTPPLPPPSLLALYKSTYCALRSLRKIIFFFLPFVFVTIEMSFYLLI